MVNPFTHSKLNSTLKHTHAILEISVRRSEIDLMKFFRALALLLVERSVLPFGFLLV